MAAKRFWPLSVLLLSACVSIEVPGLVSDTAKVAKETYQSVRGQSGDRATQASGVAASGVAPSRPTLSHSHVGTEAQTFALLKQACVQEAAKKLDEASGKPVRYVVLDNEVVSINGRPVANCKLAAEN